MVWVLPEELLETNDIYREVYESQVKEAETMNKKKIRSEHHPNRQKTLKYMTGNP